MNDEELVKRLRRADEYEPLGHDGWDAADRIEALTEQLNAARADAKEAEAYAEELEKELNICRMAQVVMENGIAEAEKERDDYAFKLADANNTYSEMHVALEEANDKLAKAEKERDEALNQLDSARHSVDVLEKRVADLLGGYDEHRKPFVTSRATLSALLND